MPKPSPIPIPIKANTNNMMMKAITETMAIANALSQPQSKKCFISRSHTKNIIIDAIKPPIKAPIIAPIIMPKTTIQIASVNFALSFPAKERPTSQSIGAMTIIATTICIKSPTISIFFLFLIIFSDCSLIYSAKE